MPDFEMFVPVGAAKRPTLCHGGWSCCQGRVIIAVTVRVTAAASKNEATPDMVVFGLVARTEPKENLTRLQ